VASHRAEPVQFTGPGEETEDTPGEEREELEIEETRVEKAKPGVGSRVETGPQVQQRVGVTSNQTSIKTSK
jgi:hypothetical protein